MSVHEPAVLPCREYTGRVTLHGRGPSASSSALASGSCHPPRLAGLPLFGSPVLLVAHLSIQPAVLPSRFSWMAMCVMAVVGAPPCQCFSPGENQTTSPGRISSIVPSHRCTRPDTGSEYTWIPRQVL